MRALSTAFMCYPHIMPNIENPHFPHFSHAVNQHYAGSKGRAATALEALRQKTATSAGSAKITKGAGKGNLRAILEPGLCYMNGIGYDKSLPVAQAWFHRGAAKGDEECTRMIATCNYAIGADFFTQPPCGQPKAFPFLLAALEKEECLCSNNGKTTPLCRGVVLLCSF